MEFGVCVCVCGGGGGKHLKHGFEGGSPNITGVSSFFF